MGQEVRTEYDAASRMTSISTNNGETIIAFGYDDANRQVWEDQTLAGYLTHGVVTPRDADGNRTKLEMYTNGVLNYGSYFDYTQRNQLSHIYWDSNHAPWINYTYDASGNITKRQDVYGGVNDSINVPSNYYDGLNRATMWENTGAGDVAFARSWYQDDNVGREVATWRDEEGSKGERFTYSPTNQMTSARYKADQAWTETPQNVARSVDYAYALDRLNRSSVTDNGAVTSYTPNAMNQYTVWSGLPAQYDGNFNFSYMGGWQYDYDAQSQLLAVTVNAAPRASFVYDGLGRCVKRTLNGVTRLFNYDGWQPIYEWDASGQFVAWNAYGAGADEILWRNQAGVGYLRYHSDAHGNVTAVLNSSGTVIERYSYDVFGQPTITYNDGSMSSNWSQGSRVGNRFMFQGREYLNEIGLYDYRHRIYDPSLGRFYQSDPMGLQTEGVKLTAGQKALFSPGGSAPEAFSSSEMNLYRYCGDDPVDDSDPLGLEPMAISARLDELGIQASDNSLRASKDGYPRSQLIQETNGTLELQKKFNEPVARRVPNYGSVVPAVMMEETATPDAGSKAIGVGHAHKDLYGRPKPGDSDFSKKDYEKATGNKKKGIMGTPVWKVNESDPRRVDRLTPDTTPGERPTKIRVR